MAHPTLAPWRVEVNLPYGEQPRIYSADDRLVAVFGNSEVARQDIWETDALIGAAALELLDVLGETEHQIEYLHEKFGATGSGNAMLARIREVRAKAEGRDR